MKNDNDKPLRFTITVRDSKYKVSMPNVVVGISATQAVATSTSLTVEGFSGALSLKGLAQTAASGLNLGLEALEAPKAIADAAGAGFAALICGIMR